MANRWEQVYKYDKKTKSWVVDEKKTQEAVKRNNDYSKSSSASRYGLQKSSADDVDPISTATASSYTPTKKSEKPAKTYDLNTNVGLDDADKANAALNAQAAGKGMINTINSVPVWTEWQNSVLYKPGSSYTIKNSPMYSDIGYAKSEQDINRQWMVDGHEYLNLSDEDFKTFMAEYDKAMGYTDSTWRLLNARVGNEHVIDQATNWKEKQKLQGAYNLSDYDKVPGQLATNVPEDFKRNGITTYRDLYNKQVAYSRDQVEKDLKTIDSFYNARYAMPGMRFDAEAEQEFADAVSRYEEYSGVDLTNMPADYDGKWIKRMMSSYDADTDMLRGVVEGSEGNWDFDDVYNRDKALLDEQRQKEQADAKGKKFEAEAGEMEAAVQNTEGYADKSQYIPGTQYWMPGSDDYNILAGGSMPSPEDTTSWEERNNRVRYSFINDFLAAVEAKDDATISDMREIAGNLGALDGYDLDAMTNMDEDQIKTAFAYINDNNYKGFEDYMRKINYDLSRKSYEKWEEAEQLKAQGRNFWEHMGASITTWPQNVLASASGLTNDISAWLEKFGIDIRDPYLEHEFSNYNRWGADVDIIRGGADQYIRDNTWSLPENIPVVGGFNPLGTLYQGAMSLGDVGLARLAGDWLGGSLGLAGKAAKKFSQFVSGLHMFGIEAGRSLQEAMAAGQDNAALKATGDATLSAIFENIGLDKVLSGNLLKAAIGEGSEEFFTGATQMVWDALLNREDSKPAKLLDKYRIMGYASKAEFAAALDTAADLFEQFMSGFSVGGVGSVTPAVTNQVQNVKAGRTIQQYDTAQPILDLAATLDLDPSVLQLVQEQQAAFDAMKASQQESEAQSEEDQDNLDDEAAIESEEEDQEAEVLPERGEYEFDGNESTLTPVGNEQEAEKLPNREEAMPDGRESTLTPAEEQQQEAEKLPNREESQPDGRESTLTPANEQQEAEKLPERETTMPDGESTLTPASEENAPAAEEAGDVSEAAEDMAEAAEDAAENPAPKKGKKVKVPKVSNAKLGRIYREALAKLDERAQDVLRKSFETEISQQLQERGFKGDPRTTAEAISKMVSGDASMITPEVVLAVSSDRMVLEIVNDFTAPIRDFQRMAALGAGGIDALKAKNAKVKGKYSMANGQRFVPERIVSISDDGKVRVTGKTVHGEVMTVDADSIDFGINDGGIEIVAGVAGRLGRNADALLNSMRDSKDPVKFALAFENAMNFGQDGRNLDIVKHSDSLSALTESQIVAAYNLGKEVREQNNGNKAHKNVSGISVGNVDTSEINGFKLNEHQKAVIKAMRKLAWLGKFNVKFVASKADANGKYKTANGSWNPDTLTLTLDIHAGSNSTADLKYAMMHTAGHELTHFIRDFVDAGLWNDYQEFVMDHLSKKMTEAELENLIQDKIKAAERKGRTMTRDGAIEEVIANASGEALMNITENDLRQLAETNHSLFTKIKKFFEKWIGDLKKLIGDAYKGTEAKTAEAKAMRDVVDQLSEKWNEMFVNAVQNKAVASKETNAAVQETQTTEESTGKATVSMRDSAAEAKPHTVSKQNETTAGAKVQPLTYNHIDTRTDESVRSVDVDLFCNEVEEAQVGFAAAAKMLLADANNSISGQKFFTGDGKVTGQKRQTSDLLARMKDETNWTWDNIRKSLQQFADMDNAEKGYPVPKNTLTNRRMELYLDEVLTEGYKTLDGLNVTQWGEYVEAKAGYKGSKKAGMNYRSPANAIAFEDYAFADAGFYDDGKRYSERVTDEETLDFLNNQETVTTYKTMQIVDGKLYPPMAAVVAGNYEDASELGMWEATVEHPELIKWGDDGKAYFKLDKGQKRGSLDARYNPYMHSSNLVLNDQFTGAYARDNLVTVECEVPVSELTSGYHAQHAKDPVGWHAWHAGPVAGTLRNVTGTERQVLLSRWIKPVRIVPDSEVAAMYKELLDGTGITVPENVVPPSLKVELEKAGVPIASKEEAKSANAALKKAKPKKKAGTDGKRYDMGGRDVDDYTSEQYNEFGWATSNGILSMNEMKHAEEKIGLLKRGNYPDAGETADNKFVIQLGDEIGIDNVLIVTDKEYGDFDISRVYRINSEFETFNEQVRDIVYEYESSIGRNAIEVIKERVGTETVVCYHKQDFLDFYPHKGNGSRSAGVLGGEMAQEVRGLHNGKRSTENAGRNGAVAAHLYQIPVDSNGRTLTISQERFFKNSKARDENGNLLVLYHGSTVGRIEVFKTVEGRRKGLYLTTSKNVAEQFAAAKGGTSPMESSKADHDIVYENAIYKLYANVENPLRVDGQGNFYHTLPTPAEMIKDGSYGRSVDIQEIGAWAIKNGYDGVIVKNVKENPGILTTDVIVFNPDQVKYTDNDTPDYTDSTRYQERDFSELSDRDGQTETPAFQNWFKGSKIVNEDGSPKVMYHGTPYGGFTVFKDWQYFTDNQAYADVYHEPSASSIRGRYNPATNPQTYAVYLSVKKPFDTRDPKIRKIWQEEFYNQYSRTPLSEKGLPDWTDGIDLVEFIEDNDYDFDAIILDEGAVGGYGDDVHTRGVSVVVRSSNQVKSATDNIGTFDPANPDIRYQERDLSELSDRELLANAVESVAQNDTERDYIKRYKKHIAELNEKQLAMQEAEEQIQKLKAEDAKGNRDEIIKLQNKVDIYAKQISRADAKLLDYEATKPIKDMLTREKAEYKRKRDARAKEQMARYRENQHQRTLDRIREVREAEANKRKAMKKKADNRLKEAVQDQREIGQRKVDRLKESQGKEKYKKRVMDDTKKLMTWITNPTAKDHVPKFLAAPIGDFLEAIDFSSVSALNGKDNTKADKKMIDALDKLRRALQKYRKEQQEFDEGKQEYLQIMDMPAEFVEGIDDLVDDLRKSFEKYSEKADDGIALADTPLNRMNSKQLQRLSEILATIRTSVRKINRFSVNGRFETPKSASNATMEDMNSMTAKVKTNKYLAKLNSTFNWKNTTPYYAFQRLGRGGKAMFEALQDGWDKMAQNSAKLIEYAKKSFEPWQAKAWSKEIKTIKLDSGDNVQMTAAQAMSFYCLSKRDQAVGHLKGGGIRISEIDAGKGNTISQVDNYILSEADISRIIGTLTAEQKAVADKLQKFMNTVCKDWGNEISMKRFGYEMFTEDYYFPIKTDANNRGNVNEKNDGNNSMFRLLNMSAMKPLTPNAKNAIIIEDIFDVFSNHSSDMAKYNALALPILDFIKWYNFVERTEVLDANGKPTGQISEKSTQKALERAYGQDAKSYIRNFIKDLNAEHDGGRNDDIINKMTNRAKAAAVGANLRVYMLQLTSLPRASYAINPVYLARSAAKLKNYNPEKLRNGGEAQDAVGILKWKNLGFYSTDTNNSVREMVRRDSNALDTVREWQMKPAGWMDNITGNIIYEAVKLEMVDKHPNLKPGTEVYNAMLNKRVREIIYKTQVVDSTMTRSELMRSKGVISAATAFMSEPTLDVNMLNEGIQEAIMKKRGAKLDPNDLSPGRKIGRAVATSLVSVAVTSIVGALPDAFRDDDDYEEFEEKYLDALKKNFFDNVNIFDKIPLIAEFSDAVQKAIKGQDYKGDTLAWQALSSATDTISAVRAWKKGEGTLANAIFNGLKTGSYGGGVGAYNAVRDIASIYNTFFADALNTPKIQTYADYKTTAAEAYYDALQDGDAEKAEWILHRAEINGYDVSDFSNKITERTKEDFFAGKIDAATAEEYLVKHAGKKPETADKSVSAWAYEQETGSKFDDMRDDYIAGTVSKAKAKEYLSKYGGKDAASADEQIDRWDYYDAMGTSEGYTKYWRMYYALENNGDFYSEARRWIDSGMKKGDIARSIAGRYKSRYLAIKGTAEGEAMLEMLLDLYEAIGYDRDYERNYINNKWTDD